MCATPLSGCRGPRRLPYYLNSSFHAFVREFDADAEVSGSCAHVARLVSYRGFNLYSELARGYVQAMSVLSCRAYHVSVISGCSSEARRIDVTARLRKVLSSAYCGTPWYWKQDAAFWYL